MTPAEEAYEEALRRIRQAKDTGAIELDLSGLETLNQLPPELERLTLLRSLDLSRCFKLSDLAPLANLTSLQSLDLSRCAWLSGDLSPLTSLTSLQTLDLSYCLGVHQFAPLESLLPTLKDLCLFGCKFDDLPLEVCGEKSHENVLDKVRAHYEDVESGQQIDAALKVFFLGNGGVGKTQLCRRLRNLPYDPNIPTTHGIQLAEMTVTLENFQNRCA
jgi:internalin A